MLTLAIENKATDSSIGQTGLCFRAGDLDLLVSRAFSD